MLNLPLPTAVYLAVLTASILYALARLAWERFRPPTELDPEPPAMVPFHEVVRYVTRAVQHHQASVDAAGARTVVIALEDRPTVDLSRRAERLRRERPAEAG